MYLKTLTIIHAASVATIVVFGSISYFFGVGFVNPSDVNNNIFIYVTPIIAIIGYFGSTYLFRKKLLQVNPSDELSSKLAKYQAASILKYALIEGPALFSFAIFMYYGYPLGFTIAICLLVYLVFQKPTKHRFIQDLQLNNSEQKQL